MSKVEASPNVYGVETEYSCTVTLPGNVVHEIVGECHSRDADLGLYVEPKGKGTSGISDVSTNAAFARQGITRVGLTGMLSNGGRFYFDPSGPEYATPETRTAEEAAHRTFDGDEIVLRMFARLREEGVIEGFQFNRRIVDHNRSSRGIHLNTATQLSPGDIDSEEIEQIAALNVVKGALFGSGGLLVNDKDQTEFHHSPRLSVTNTLSANYANYSMRPLVRLPFKQDGSLYRVETVTSDALNFAWPMRASMVVTNALIGLMEMGCNRDLPILHDSVSSAHAVGLAGNAPPLLAYQGAETVVRKPLDLLRDICEEALRVDGMERHLDDESDQVLGEIIEVADKMSKDPDSVARQVESVARLAAMRRKMDKKGLDLGSEDMCRFDYAWDLIGGGGTAEALRTRNTAGWLGFSRNHSPIDMKKRLAKPPRDTRAHPRGNAIKDTWGANSSDWSMVDFGHEDGESAYLHPLATEETKLWVPSTAR